MAERMNWEEQTKRIEESVRLRDEANRALHTAQSEYLEHLQSFRCVICGKAGSLARLMGGRSVALCIGHANAWHEFLNAHELRDEYNDTQAGFYVAIYQCDEKTAKERNRVWQDVTNAIYALSGGWLKEEKTKWQQER